MHFTLKRQKKTKVLMIDASDYISFPTGGQLSFERNLLKFSDEDFDISLVGLTTDPKEKVGEWTYRIIGSRKFLFLPVYCSFLKTLDKRPKVPIRVATSLGVFLRKRKIGVSFDIIYVHAPELALLFLILRGKAKLVYHIHGIPEYAAINARYSFIRERWFVRLYTMMARYVIKKADRLIWVSHEGLQEYTSLFPGIKDKSVVIPTSVDTEIFKPMNKAEVRQHWRFDLNDKIVMFVGRLGRLKGLNLLIESFSKVLRKLSPNLKLVLVGDGDEKDSLINKTKKLGINSNVIFTGKIEHNKLAQIINCADIATFTSVPGEGFPLALLEILACGVPVVSTKVGDVGRVVINGQTGFLVETRDPRLFADRMLNTLKMADKFRRNCIKITNEYSAENIAKKVFGELRNIMK